MQEAPMAVDKVPAWCARLSFQNAIVSAASASHANWSYPVLAHRKKRAAIITYRHSEQRWFENAFTPRA
jgi:hypothetical protein